jgi:predicted ATPase/class 3 adenylate cyclase
MDDASAVETFLFTDIEGSSRLWEREPARMQVALARHDALARGAVADHRGSIVKMTGDGMCAVFDDPLCAIDAALAFLRGLAALGEDDALELKARCGIHVGGAQRRDNDYFGTTVNRAARIMSAAHGGQVLLSQPVVDLVRGRLPETLSLRDLGLVRLRDLASPEHLYQVLHPALRQDFPALRSLEATPNNLPQQSTSFVGRERELAEARAALVRTRLLTLFGAGGIGKTRLSLQLAAEVLDDYPDGAWFVELAPIADARIVPQAVASALGVKEEGGRSITDTLVAHLADKTALVVLDNCEHLLDACARIAERLLREAPRVKLLASSREPMRIAGEAVYPVPALAVPDAGARAEDAAVAAYASVRLFLERASAVLPTFRITDANAATVAAICRHLDGIPLAIELAAARVRAMPLDMIASRLHDRFHLLTGGSRTALPRQQTLRALIDWSHELLSPAERVLFRRLSVFAGGWTLDAADQVCSGEDVARSQVLDLLASLVDKSLVVADLEVGRYRMLETIREYAAERLRESGEEATLRDRHLDHCLALAETAAPHLYGPEQGAWYSQLDADRDNLRAAHSWCDRAAEGGSKGLRLVNAIKPYWFSRGLLKLGKHATIEALDRPGAQARDPQRCHALFAVGQLCSFLGDYGEAIGYLGESLSIARELGDRLRVAATLQPLGLAAVGRGDFAAGRQYLDEALALAKEIGDLSQIAGAANAVAQVHRMEGSLGEAEPLYAEVIAAGRNLRDPYLVAVGLLNLAMVYVARGAHGGARQALQEVLAIAEETKSMPAGQSALEVASGFAAALGEPERSLRYFAAAEANTDLTGIQRDPTDDAFLRPLIAKAREALDAAAAKAAERAGHDAGYERTLADVRSWLAAPPVR